MLDGNEYLEMECQWNLKGEDNADKDVSKIKLN